MITSSVAIEPRHRAFAPGTYPGIEGRVVLNTGGASGIGLAMANAFARHGAHLVLLDIDAAGLAIAKHD